jgi:hypothetical protein
VSSNDTRTLKLSDLPYLFDLGHPSSGGVRRPHGATRGLLQEPNFQRSLRLLARSGGENGFDASCQLPGRAWPRHYLPALIA